MIYVRNVGCIGGDWSLYHLIPSSSLPPPVQAASNYNKTEFLKFLLKLCFHSPDCWLEIKTVHDIHLV